MYDVKKRLISCVFAFLIFLSSVFVSYQTAYASVSITEAGSYFFRMLCSAAGVYFDHSEVGLVVDVLSQVAAQSDTINSKEFQERMDYVLSLSPADRIDETFSNAFLADLINGFRESTVNEDGHGGGGISFPVSVGALYTFEKLNYYSGIPSFYVPSDMLTAIGGYKNYVLQAKDGGWMYLIASDYPISINIGKFGSVSSPYYASSVNCSGTGLRGTAHGANTESHELVIKDSPSLTNASSADYYISGDVSISLLGEDIAYGKSTSVNPERIWVDAFDDAALHVPAITAPITIPADTTAMEENAKAVAAADNADALYKALAGAGIAVDVTIPDETDKPTDVVIPDDTVSIGKSLSDIIAGINALGAKIAFIPDSVVAGIKDALTALFIPDSNFFSNEVNSLLDALKAVLPYQDYIDALSKIKDFSSGNLEDIKVNVSGSRIVESGGTQVTIVSFSGIRDSLPTYHKWVRGLFLVLLVLFNVNQLYKLIRGVSLFAGGRDE